MYETKLCSAINVGIHKASLALCFKDKKILDQNGIIDLYYSQKN